MNGELPPAKPMDLDAVCTILRPLFDLGDFRDLNGPAGQRLAELIHPGDARDLTVAQLHALLQRVSDEMSAPVPAPMVAQVSGASARARWAEAYRAAREAYRLYDTFRECFPRNTLPQFFTEAAAACKGYCATRLHGDVLGLYVSNGPVRFTSCACCIAVSA